VLPPLAALASAWVTAQVGSAEVRSSEVRCGEIIAAIYGQLEPAEEVETWETQ